MFSNPRLAMICIALVLGVLGHVSFAQVYIDDCEVINESGVYVLDDDIYGADFSSPHYGESCIWINTSDVVLDCDGYYMEADDYGQVGILVDGDGEDLYNVTVRNCSVYDYNYGLATWEAYESNFSNNTFVDNYRGTYLMYSDYNYLTNNYFAGGDYGFYLYEADHNQIGYNIIENVSYTNIGSCPFLYLWDGDGYEYYTDLASESLGGSWFETPLYEAGIYELGNFQSTDGLYRMKVREIIPESDFFDEAKLVLVDVPEGYQVLNQWHNTYSDDEAPPKEFMTIKDPKAPMSAEDRYGNDVLAQISGEDGVPLPTYEEPNYVIVDFGNIDNPEYAKLVITGWSSYESNPDFSSQRNLKIEIMNESGEWETAKLFGKFTGDSRTFVFDISGILETDDTRMRISAAYSKTTVNVMDQILLDDSEPVEMEISYVDPSYANLQWGGSATYEYATTEHRHSATDESRPNDLSALMYGNFTKYGDVSPLLEDADDMFAIMRHGDELVLEFEDIAQDEGTDRYAFLQADVMYTIKYSVKGFIRDTINPMPFHGMSQYPYADDESYPYDAEHLAYIAEWNTREYVKEPGAGMSLPYSDNNTVFSNLIRNIYIGLLLDNEYDTKLLDNNISNVYQGIYLHESESTTIRGNNITNASQDGIYLEGSFLSNISWNYISDAPYAIRLVPNDDYSDDNDITHNTFIDTDYALYLDDAWDNYIAYNNFTDNYWGIYLYDSSYNEILYNNITDSNYGFYLDESNHNQIGYNRIVDFTWSNIGSCPFLFLWDGSEYEYYTDLSGEPIGLPWLKSQMYESGIYELGDFKPDDGLYKLKLREVIPESDFLDKLKLAVVDVPEGYSVLNEWSYSYGLNQAPDKGFMTIRDAVAPLSAIDSYGNDVLAEVSEKDGIPAPIYGKEQNPIVLDFGTIDNPEHAKLIMTGWDSYEKTPAIGAHNYLIIETMGAGGEWTVAKTLGGFAGDSRTIVYNISGILTENDTLMRISPKYSVSAISVVDQVLLDDSEPVDFTVSYVDPDTAELQWGGSTPYDYATTEHRHANIEDTHLPDVTESLMYGNFTKYGDVSSLLEDADDMFAIMRHGDELVLEFEDIGQDEGTDRYVFLEVDVMYSIKSSINGFVRDTINPMPFHGMSQYPYADDESYPYDAEHLAYIAEWNTREYVKEPGAGMSLPYSTNNTVFSNLIIGDGAEYGLELDHENGTSLLDNNISGCYCGLYIYRSENTTISGNNINDSDYGVYLDYSNNTNMSMNSVWDSSEAGVYIYNSNGTHIFRDQYYDNTPDVQISASADFLVELEEVMFDNDLGLPENFTNLSVYDWLSSGEAYSLDWAEEPAAPPETSFRQRYINISEPDEVSVSPSIDTLIWHWRSPELGGYNENGLFIMEYDGGWFDVDSVLDAGDNTLTVTNLSNFSIFAVLSEEAVEADSDGGSSSESLSISIEPSCEGNVVTATSGGDEVKGVRVVVTPEGGVPEVYYTDSDGEVVFEGCGMDVELHASKSGYKTADLSATLISCAECLMLECTEDSDCSYNERCVENECIPEPECEADSDCGSGMMCQDNECISEPECTEDSDCAEGEVCSGQECVAMGCTSDGDCLGSEYCDEGECMPVTGDCGQAVDHDFVPYECGSESGCPDCPLGLECVNHECTAVEHEYDLSCPTEGQVGEEQTCTITKDGKPCDGCDYKVTGPDGKSSTGKTDENGKFVLPLAMEGSYEIAALTEDALVLEKLSLEALAGPAAEKPPEEPAGDDGMLLVIILIILAAVAAFYLIKRKRK